MPLSVGASGAVRIFVAACGVIGMLMAAAFVAVGLTGGALIDRIAGGDPQFSQPAGTASTVLRFIGLCGLPVAAIMGLIVLRTLRYAAWLHGTTLLVRGAFSTRSVDLATADVRGDVITHQSSRTHFAGTAMQRREVIVYSIPALAARDPATGREVKIPLRGQGLRRLPAGELYALADAIMVRRPHGDPHYPTAHKIAMRLRQMADDPFPV